MRRYAIFLLILSIIYGTTGSSAISVLAEDMSSSTTDTAMSTSTPPVATASSTEDITVLNQEIAARKDKIKQLEDTINNYKQVITEKQTESISLKNQLSILDARIGQAQADLDLTNEQISQTELEMKTLQSAIDIKATTIERQKKILAKMVEGIHASDQKNYFEIMLTYNNFADFYNEVQNTESVYVDLGRSVKTLRSAKEDLAAKQVELNNKKLTYLNFKNQLEDNQAALNEQLGLKQTLLSETNSSEQRYQTLLTSLKQQYQVVEDEQRTFEDKLRNQLESEDKIKPTGEVVMSWPVPSHHINALFHDKNYPFINVFQHSGIDIKASYGTEVHAAAPGYVAVAKHCTTASCYSYILLVHNGTISSVYGHLSKILVSPDQFINRGDVIGYSGGTPGTVGAGPFVTGAHLHFEVRVNGIPVDPVNYMEQ